MLLIFSITLTVASNMLQDKLIVDNTGECLGHASGIVLTSHVQYLREKLTKPLWGRTNQ